MDVSEWVILDCIITIVIAFMLDKSPFSAYIAQIGMMEMDIYLIVLQASQDLLLGETSVVVRHQA
jgi:hypothetical protein